jgi:tungstate transport system substrate-binding protein
MRRFVVLVLVALVSLSGTARAVEDVVVQGTTDVRDAGLLDDVIIPGFEAAYPQYDLQYIGVGTGQALASARSGDGDAALVHAAPTEAQFVADGFSAESFGRAIFYSDYVIVGPASDPAGVLTGAPHDAVHAFELIARAGEAGTANFVSRGDASGTNVAEQQLWNRTTGLTLCTPAAGRKQPSTSTSTCTDPSWYHRAGVGQAETVQIANQCPFATSDPDATSSDSCYEMTDRGTFNRLIANGSISNLQIVADRNSSTARGGDTLLTNYFHAYVINPDKFDPGTINVAGATAFLDYLTSKDFQNSLASYPDTTNPAFFASAAPSITASDAPEKIKVGKDVTITGKIANKTPGTPPLSGITVSAAPLGELQGAAPLATATTTDVGSYSLTFSPTRSGLYAVGTPQITETVIPGTPPFGDILQPETQLIGRIAVKSKVTLKDAKVKKDTLTVNGTIAPATDRSKPKLTLLGNELGGGSKAKARKLGSVKLAKKGAKFDEDFDVKPGKYRIQVRYSDKGVVKSSLSKSRVVTVHDS